MGSGRSTRPVRWWFAAILGVAAAFMPSLKAADRPKPADDATYRPTVMIRGDNSLGTGTVIASVEGDTLILTAYHVIAKPGPIFIELHRYNFGVEHVQAVTGFPRRVEATVIVKDADTDLAILRIREPLRFPYVARIARGDDPPAIGAKVTTIGFDKGAKLIGFSTKVRLIDRIELRKGGGFRPFVVTEDPPEVGRSGGGLFLADGSLVGVCTGRADSTGGRTIGVFSSLGNVRDLIRTDDDIAALVARASRKARSSAK